MGRTDHIEAALETWRVELLPLLPPKAELLVARQVKPAMMLLHWRELDELRGKKVPRAAQLLIGYSIVEAYLAADTKQQRTMLKRLCGFVEERLTKSGQRGGKKKPTPSFELWELPDLD
jgi:hypothetical protein